jgi:predicted DNA-binding transcriptional regulator AlpA
MPFILESGAKEPEHMTDPTPNDLCTPEEAAAFVGRGVSTIWRAQDKGKLRQYRKPGNAKAVFYSKAEVRRWDDQRRAARTRK